MSVSIEKRVSGGWKVVLYGTIIHNVADLGYKTDSKGIRLVNDSGGFESPEDMQFSDWTIAGVSGFADFDAVANELDLLGVVLNKASSGGGGGGTGDASQAQQIVSNTRLQEIATDLAALEVLEGDENTKIEDVKTKLDTLITNGGNDLTELQAIKTSLAAIDVDSDQLALIKTNLDTTITEANETQAAINAAAAAEALRDADQLTALNANVSKNEEVRAQLVTSETARAADAAADLAKDEESRVLLEEIRDDQRAQKSTSTQVLAGKDDSNDTPILQITETIDGVKQPVVYENLDRTTYDLAATGGNFVIDQAVTTQYELTNIDYRAKSKNTLAGYEVNDIIEYTKVTDVSVNPSVIISEKYKNTETATDLVTANVVETELTKDLNIPDVINSKPFFLIENDAAIGIVYRVTKSDESFVWVNEVGTVLEDPNPFAGQELVELDKCAPIDENIASYTFPIIFEANTIKDIDINVLSGDYTITIGNFNPLTLNENTSGRSYPKAVQIDNYVDYRIQIDEVTAGELELSGNYFGTLARLAANTQNTVDQQDWINANSNFILRTNDASLITVDGADAVTQVDVPADTGTTGFFTPGSGNFQIVDAPNGRKAITSTTSTSNTDPLNLNSGISNAEETRIVAVSADMSQQSPIFRYLGFLNQLSIATTNFSYNLNDGNNFQTRPVADANLTTSEANGTSAVIFVIDRTLINGGADYQIQLSILSENNPTGFVIGTGTRAIGSSITSRSVSPSARNMHAAYAVAFAARDAFIADAKQQAGLTF